MAAEVVDNDEMMKDDDEMMKDNDDKDNEGRK